MTRKFIAYYRVSTDKQGISGLGLEAQRKAVTDYLNGGRWTLVAELNEVESGRRTNRPQLKQTLALCRIHRATLIIAKLDRLARNLHFLTRLMNDGVEFCVLRYAHHEQADDPCILTKRGQIRSRRLNLVRKTWLVAALFLSLPSAAVRAQTSMTDFFPQSALDWAFFRF